jgi:DegV family protein with EDD domain
MTVRIITDTACDLPEAVVRELGIIMVPLTIRFGDDEFVDRRDLDAAEFWHKVATSPTLPETAAPAPGDFIAAYQQARDEGATGIVVITLSGELSGTLSSARVAADASPIPIEIVDSRSVTMGEGLTVMACAQAAAAGASMADIVASAHDLARRTRVLGALDSLEHLRKGGRIGGAKAMLASALSIKPLIDVRDGRVEEGGRQRTRSKAMAWLVEQVRVSPRLERLAVMHAQCDDVHLLVEALTALGRDDLLEGLVIGDLGPVVGTHAGPRTIGVAFHVASEATAS